MNFHLVKNRTEKLSAGIHHLAFTTLLSATESQRMRETRELLGASFSETDFITRFGTYLLDDALVHEARLSGLVLPANGEILEMSAKNWKISEEEFSWSALDISEYLKNEGAKIREFFVPKWAEQLAVSLNVPLEKKIEFYSLTLAHLELTLRVSVEK